MATIDTLIRKFSEICRLCLKQDGVMESIFQKYDLEDDENSLAQRISTIARVQLNEGDGLPTLICHICRQQVENAYKFRQLVEISDRTLRNCLDTPKVEGTNEEQNIAISQENSDQNIELIDDENIDLEQFLIQNDLADPNIDVILVESEDIAQVLNICSIVKGQDAKNLGLDSTWHIKKEYSISQDKAHDLIAPDACIKDESTAELDDLEGIRQLLNSGKIYVQDSEDRTKIVYSCPKCQEIFLTKDETKDHYSNEHVENGEELDDHNTDISCQLCSAVFNSLSELKNHITEHLSQHKNLKSIDQSEAHACKIEKGVDDNVVNALNDDYHYVLEDVSKSDENGSEIVAENDLIDVETGDDVENEIIRISRDEVDSVVEYKPNMFYCVKEYLSDRMRSRTIGNYPCNLCDKVFTQRHEHTLHLRRHNGIKPYKCTFCDKAFITNALRKDHERSHMGDKTFVCVVCGKSFFKKSELKYHEGIHVDGPPTCKICNKEFSNTQSYKMHTKRHLLGSRYVCETCGKSYYTNSELARHVQVHSGKREYPCDLCDTSFLSRPELNRHLKYHIGVKKFHCKLCPKSYFESGHLKIHERVHTGEKPYICKVCNKAFVTKPKLVRHEKIHAKEIIGNCYTGDDNRRVEDVKTEAMS